MILEALDNLVSHFSTDNLKQFFIQKISTFRLDDEDYEYLFDDDITDNFTDIVKVGEADLYNSDDLLVIAVRTLSQLTSRTGKKRQYEIAKKILKEEVKDAAIFVFYDDNGNFRFSLIRSDYLGVKREFTTFKRYTFFLSPELTNRTFRDQISSADFNNLDNIQEAFSVEPLNKEFYHQVTDAFYNLIGGRLATNEYKAVLELPSVSVHKSRKIYQEFAVRLIGRTIFVWFLKNKTSHNGTPLIPKDWLTSTKVKETPNYYHTYLEKLFFEILNKPSKERIDDLPEGNAIIPFLNGGLFEPHLNDFYELGYGGYSKYLNTLKIPDSWFETLFETLERFNFTIDENSIDDQEVSIDPEMLGTIFENLLAEIDPDTEKSARKSTGSFYTPREIVDFMVTESLVNYLQTKTGMEDSELRHLFAENSYQITDPATKDKLLNAFDEIKIIDPACGSGAFPMGVLHKINSALQKLDPDANNWKEKQLSKIDNIAYRKALKEKLDKSNVDYIRKLGIIQHSIYGVDIQSIATEISKLRSFLSLIVDENIDDDANNRGIYPLPNLEFKFITANTLIPLEKEVRKEYGMQGQFGLDFDNTEQDIKQLQKIRDNYLQAYGKEKEELKSKFLLLQKQIAQKEYSSTSRVNKRAQQIIGWNPFNYEKSDWFDPKWMFGVDGFDVVISNPPYLDYREIDAQTKESLSIYKTNENSVKPNLYLFFIEKGIYFLKENGILSYINPAFYLSIDSGFGCRKFLLFNTKLNFIVDVSHMNVFKSASTYTIINQFQKVDTSDYLIKVNRCNEYKNLSGTTLMIDINEILEDKYFRIPLSENVKILRKIEVNHNTLSNLCTLNWGTSKTGYGKLKITREDFEVLSVRNKELYKPIVQTSDIKRFFIEWHGEYIPISIYSNRIKTEFNKRKLLIARVTKNIQVCYDDKGFFVGKATLLTDCNISYELLLGILNSKVINFWYYHRFESTHMAGGYLRYDIPYLKQIPIPKVNLSTQKEIENKVVKIVHKKQLKENTVIEEKDIDLMVYKLYELTYDEVKVVEPGFELTKEEYDSCQIIEQ